MLYVVATLFTLFGAGCLVLVLVGLPGVWIMIATACLIELLDGIYLSEESQPTFGWAWILVAIGLAGVGELLEFLASALGAKSAGSSTRGMVGAIIGGILGIFIFAVPIPVVGIVIGAVIGTFVGATMGELTADKATLRGSIKPATGATVGRILGTVGKLGVGVAVWLMLSVLAFWP